MPQINTDLCRSFKKIVTGGWAQHSNGDVESPTGHFAYIPISINELVELSAACLDDDDDAPVEGQYYIFVEDSDGNGSLYIYGSTREALDHFNRLTEEYERWLEPEQDFFSDLPLQADSVNLCPKCREALSIGTSIRKHLDQDCLLVKELPSRSDEKLYLVCNGCGEAFDSIEYAHEHGVSDPQSKSWCGDEGFVILPESEAL